MEMVKYNEANLLTRNYDEGVKVNNFTNTLTENTKRAYMVDIMQFFNVENFSDITPDMIRNVNTATARQYTDLLMTVANNGKGYALSTINRKLTALSSFYSYLCRHEVAIMDYNPFATNEGAKRLRQNKTYSNTRCLTIEEISMMDAVASKYTDARGIRNRIILLTLFTTGLRREELINIKIGDIQRSNGQWVVEIVGKGNKPRLVVITESIKLLIDKYMSMRRLNYTNGYRYLFASHSSNADYKGKDGITSNTVYRVVRDLAKEAGLDESTISPHCFRHSYATESIELGLPIQDVADLMGHNDISTTKRYAHTNRVVTHNPARVLESKLQNFATPC